MTHRLATTRAALLASVLSVTALSTASCSLQTRQTPRPLPAAVSASAAAPAAQQPPSFTAAQAQAALITESDLGEPWVPTRGAATWRDGLLKATAENTDCQQLLDVLYTEELFGTPTGPRAATAFDDGDSDTQLRYQVATHRPADVDRALSWLKSLPQRCGQFRAATTRGGLAGVEVTEMELPEAGDARQALRVTLTGETDDGELAYLVMDVAGARVGEEAITLTNGGLGEVYAEVTQRAVQLGAQRLTEIRKHGRADV